MDWIAFGANRYGTPLAMGVSANLYGSVKPFVDSGEVLALLRGMKGVNLVGGDIVEVAPQYDANTSTAQAGAQVMFEILSLMVFSPSISYNFV